MKIIDQFNQHVQFLIKKMIMNEFVKIYTIN